MGDILSPLLYVVEDTFLQNHCDDHYNQNYHKSLIGILYKELNMQIQLILSSFDKIRECSSDHVRHRTRD